MSSANGTVRGQTVRTRATVTSGRGGVGGEGAAKASGRSPAGRSALKRSPGQVAKRTRLGWAYAGVGLTLVASAALNGLAFSSAAPVAWAGWALGFLVPVLVLVFSRVCVGAWEGGRRGPAYLAGGATLAILGLSVQHLAASIAVLTGEGIVTAYLMAVAIDAGLVACEWWTVGK